MNERSHWLPFALLSRLHERPHWLPSALLSRLLERPHWLPSALLSQMNERSPWLRLALFGILTGCSGGTPTPPIAGGSVPNTGARLYDANCIACHQPDARGIPGVYPSLVGSPVVLGDPQELALWVVKGQRPPSMPAGRYSTVMPQFGWMKPGDAAALCTYLRSSFGNAAAAVDAATLARALGQPP